MAAFRIISENLDDKKYPGIKVRDIEIWAKSKISILNEQSNKLFAQYDKNNKGVNLYLNSKLSSLNLKNSF